MADKVIANVVEGTGRFECLDTSHKEPFVTNDLAKFEEHLKDGGHVKQGVEPCALCDKEVQVRNQPVGRKAICKECLSFYSAIYSGDKK
jgi:hypothetical protein